MKIEVSYKRVYGNERFYPKSEDAKNLCKLMRCSTLSKEQLIQCKEGGWEVLVIQEEYKI